MAKYIFVTGGVLSSLGKGITASAMGAIFKAQGYSVMIKKFDPYLNFNPGMMSPLQHGEVFVTEDGGEGDLDLGHYERFINANTSKKCDITSGKIYYNVIENERRGLFHGTTVQVIPHITDEIKHHIMDSDEDYDIIFVEIGGTVGDIEGQPFLEAIRQMKFYLDANDVAYVHVTPLIYVKTAGELKTKPTQHSVQKLREIGITPDLLVCRSEYPVTDELRKKLALFCNLNPDYVISALDASPLYQVVLNIYQEGAHARLAEILKLENRHVDLSAWENLIYKIKNPKHSVNIGVVGKYIDMKDAYISLNEALTHGGIGNDTKVNIDWIVSEDLNSENYSERLKNLDAILIPGGFGARGMEGKILAARYARTMDIPFLGVGSLGMQCAVIEVARYVMKLNGANSMEADPNTPSPVFVFMDNKGNECCEQGRMRLGSYSATLDKSSLAYRIYQTEHITERHRHRLEFNNQYREDIVKAGLYVTGINEKLDLVEIVEFKSHRWYFACQFIPEYKSRPLSPHPLFISFVEAALKYSQTKSKVGNNE